MGIPVKGKEHWFRDEHSKSIQCSNKSAYEKYMTAYKAEQKKEEDFDTLQKEVSELKSEMSEIKSLLLTLVQAPRKHYDD